MCDVKNPTRERVGENNLHDIKEQRKLGRRGQLVVGVWQQGKSRGNQGLGGLKKEGETVKRKISMKENFGVGDKIKSEKTERGSKKKVESTEKESHPKRVVPGHGRR